MVHLTWIKYSRYFQSFKIARYWCNSENSCLIRKSVETKTRNWECRATNQIKKKLISAVSLTSQGRGHFILFYFSTNLVGYKDFYIEMFLSLTMLDKKNGKGYYFYSK